MDWTVVQVDGGTIVLEEKLLMIHKVLVYNCKILSNLCRANELEYCGIAEQFIGLHAQEGKQLSALKIASFGAM